MLTVLEKIAEMKPECIIGIRYDIRMFVQSFQTATQFFSILQRILTLPSAIVSCMFLSASFSKEGGLESQTAAFLSSMARVQVSEDAEITYELIDYYPESYAFSSVYNNVLNMEDNCLNIGALLPSIHAAKKFQ